ncbi:uncharacterized protein DS421_9g267830 [Arachis hypogaea]|nr:uncharacterized protein DS421_9g267830 [Arachis hypogaea]
MRCATNPIYRFPKPGRNWLDLPYELTVEIMSKVGALTSSPMASKKCALFGVGFATIRTRGGLYISAAT